MAAVLALGAFAAGLLPGLGWADVAEAQTVPYLAGIFHPTGFPAYAIAGWLFTHGLPFGSVAWRMNVFSAVLAALATGLLAVAARRLGAGSRTALLAALGFATAPVVWEHATRAGTEALTLAAIALMLTFALAGWTVAAATTAGVALATHPVALWYLPALVLLLAAAPPAARSLRRLALAGVGLAAGLALYAYLPLRSVAIGAAGLDRSADLPLGFHAVWDYDHPSTPAGFLRLVTGADEHAAHAFGALLDPQQYGAYANAIAAFVPDQLGWIGVAFVIAGIWTLRARPLTLSGMLAAACGIFPFATVYPTEDASKYLLGALWALAVLAAAGAAACVRALARRSRVLGFVPRALLAIVIGLHVVQAGPVFEQRSDRAADDFVVDVHLRTTDGAVIATPWFYAMPLFHAAYVTHELGERVIATNVTHAELADLARTRTVYYLPVPRSDVVIPGVTLIRVAGAYADMYAVKPVTATR